MFFLTSTCNISNYAVSIYSTFVLLSLDTDSNISTGCLSEQNTNTSDNAQYGLVYNFFDELAQATCTAVVPSAAYVAAVRRNCASGVAAECTVICERLG